MRRLFMVVESKSVSLHTHREGEIVDITSKVQAILERGNLSDGVAFLFVPGSTGALTTIEYEPGLLTDFPALLDRLIPRRFLTSMRNIGMMGTDIHMLERP